MYSCIPFQITLYVHAKIQQNESIYSDKKKPYNKPSAFIAARLVKTDDCHYFTLAWIELLVLWSNDWTINSSSSWLMTLEILLKN